MPPTITLSSDGYPMDNLILGTCMYVCKYVLIQYLTRQVPAIHHDAPPYISLAGIEVRCLFSALLGAQAYRVDTRAVSLDLESYRYYSESNE